MSGEERERKALSLARLTRSKQHLKSARDLVRNDDFADSVSRSYYAIFQAARALLALEGIERRKHSGVISLFNRNFVKTGKLGKRLGVILKDAKRSREMADYTELAEFSREDAEGQIADAEFFIREVERLIAKES
ncbi:MAG: HEPN domain-containing protein [Deltaproteobacteria bacterium]|jgi:uncharacterized protein (UPF0332 family)|nr:HEPN domain-containing protein [Deltaproteobacteria bacterium]MBI2230993.1 HEPN domain-containing protein [Deltaproteobacteria bacterium]MBI3064794.1 HEPN domain-containing protein [Deltaproteobacteria bacterium]